MILIGGETTRINKEHKELIKSPHNTNSWCVRPSPLHTGLILIQSRSKPRWREEIREEKRGERWPEIVADHGGQGEANPRWPRVGEGHGFGRGAAARLLMQGFGGNMREKNSS